MKRLLSGRWMVPALIGASSFAASAGAHAQAAAEDPAHTTAAPRGHHRPLFRRAPRPPGGAHDWTVALTTRRGACYEVVARAAGDSRVTLALQARRARIAEPVSIASGAEAARAHFCATLPGRVYSAVVHADGATRWALAVRAAPAEPAVVAVASPMPAPSSPAPAASAAPVAVVTIPIGGTENDFVGSQIRATAQPRASRAIVAAERAVLGTNEARVVELPLTAGHCILAVAAGVPSATDVNLEIADPAGNRVAEDSAHRGVESVSFCPPYSGRYRLTVRMFAGHGLTGIQAFEVR